jgi:DNA repair exonuclease SbcCD ATPase subunit
MAEKAHSSDQFLDLPEDDPLSGEQIDSQVQKAQERLFLLKREQDHIEKQKRELEELGRRQEQLHNGRSEMVEKFTRALVVVDREVYDTQKRVENLQGIRESFAAHAENLEAINPKSWDGLDINKELNKALSAVDDAKAEYNRSLPKITPEADTDGGDQIAASAGLQYDYAGNEQKDFLYWLKSGFAFTLPLLAVCVILIIVLIALFNR